MSLKYSQCDSIYVVAKDIANKKILLGGLGILGVGQMWLDMIDNDSSRKGYLDAPEINYNNQPKIDDTGLHKLTNKWLKTGVAPV